MNEILMLLDQKYTLNLSYSCSYDTYTVTVKNKVNTSEMEFTRSEAKLSKEDLLLITVKECIYKLETNIHD